MLVDISFRDEKFYAKIRKYKLSVRFFSIFFGRNSRKVAWKYFLTIFFLIRKYYFNWAFLGIVQICAFYPPYILYRDKTRKIASCLKTSISKNFRYFLRISFLVEFLPLKLSDYIFSKHFLHHFSEVFLFFLHIKFLREK